MSGSRDNVPRLRVKLGLNPYSNDFTCAHCRGGFQRGGFFLRLDQDAITVDLPLCATCLDTGTLYESMISFRDHDPSYPVGLA